MPISRLAFAETDTERAHEVLRMVYVDHEALVRRAAPGDEVAFRQRHASAGPLAVGRAIYRMDCEVRTAPLDTLIFGAVLGGRVELRQAGAVRRLGPGDVLVNVLDRPLTNICQDIDLLTVNLDPGVVAEHAAARTGMDAAGFRFEGTAPRSAAMAHFWRETMIYLHHLFDALDDSAGPMAGEALVLREAAGVAAEAALRAFPNTALMLSYQAGPGFVAPAVVGRAVALIEARPEAELTEGRLAAEAGVDVRTLREGFRRHLGTTPTAYLRRVRLQWAHRDLQVGDTASGDTVGAVALRWGFADLAGFNRAYRQAYAQSPGHTLHT